jgi:LmbE family N-acetylglucosaminyl deacetylase
MEKVIVISAHPDDEVLGCGGTLLKHKHEGDEIHWIIITGVFEKQGYTKEIIQNRQQEIEKINNLIGVSSIHQLNYPTMSLNSASLNKLIPQISTIFKKINPEVIYVMNRSDAHSDHRVAFEAIMVCTKSFRYPSIKKILMYECISETEFAAALPENAFLPNYFVDISPYMEQKITMMKVYGSEIDEQPFPRSVKNIEALAIHRGAQSGVEYAESFMIIKEIWK